jgi:ATP-dependent Lhr-like helicase
VRIAARRWRKDIELIVTTPNFKARATEKDAAWRDIAESVYALCQDSRTVIAFADGRAYAEKLAYYVNQLGGEALLGLITAASRKNSVRGGARSQER